MHQRNLPLEDADEEQIQLANELMDMVKKKKKKIPVQKKIFF